MRLIVAILILLSLQATAQYEAFTYQGLLLDDQSAALENVDVEFIVTILADNNQQDIFYRESHLTTTDGNGSIAFNVGQGIGLQGSFSAIDWLGATPLMQVEYDLNDNKGLRNLGTQTFSSVLFCINSRYVTCSDGPDGPQGPEGPQGPQAAAGASGQTGLRGPTGSLGVPGNPVMERLSIPPTAPEIGLIYLDDGTNRYDNLPGFRYYDGTDWIDLG